MPDKLSMETSHGKHLGLDADDVLKQPRLTVSPRFLSGGRGVHNVQRQWSEHQPEVSQFPIAPRA